jgi:alpha-glucosidase
MSSNQNNLRNVAVWWRSARSAPPPMRVEPSPRRRRVHGRHTLSAATIESVTVLRASVWSEGLEEPPPSWAIDETLLVDWRPEPAGTLPLDVRWWQDAETRTMLRFDLADEARCLGLGERYGGLNRRGRAHTLLSLDDPNHTEATDAMYKSIPFLLVTEGDSTVGIFLDSPAPQRWLLDTERRGEGRVELLTRRGWEAYVFGPGPLPEVVRAYTRLTGRSPLPPRWSLGHQQSRWSYPTEKRVREVAREFRKRRIPCDTVVLDIDYLDEYRVFTISRERFPRFERMVADLRKQGFRILPIVDPGVKQDTSDETYREGSRLGVFCLDPGGSPFVGQVWAGACCFPDFLRAEVRDWWQQRLGFLLSRGVAGVWNDMNEPAIFGQQHVLSSEARELPPESEQAMVHSVTSAGQTNSGVNVGHLEVRNLYGQGMARASWDAQRQQQPDVRPFVLTRSCYAGMQRHGAVWLGDNKSWFEHLRMSIPMLLGIGLSGFAFCGVDVGGFGGDCDAELLTRWYQVGIFYPYFRNHSALDQRAQEPWAHGPETEANIRRLIETRYKLVPYIEQLFADQLATGAPLMRPLEWHAAGDEVAREIEDEFFFGRNILVAPIVQRGHSRRPVYLPQGRWHPFDSEGQPLRGRRYHSIHWGLDRVPAFVRGGSILPVASVVQHTGELEEADITFRCYGSRAHGVFREDDGNTFAYARGEYNEWRLTFRNGRFTATPRHLGRPRQTRRYFVEAEGVRRRVKLG